MLVVRPATLEDASAIAAIEARDGASPWTEDSVTTSLERASTLAFVAVERGAIAGFLLGSAVMDEGEVWMIRVDPSARGHGIGRALMEATHAAWHALGVRHAFLEVRPDNHSARALYRATGWIEAGHRTRYYADGSDAIVATLDLTTPSFA